MVAHADGHCQLQDRGPYQSTGPNFRTVVVRCQQGYRKGHMGVLRAVDCSTQQLTRVSISGPPL